jgi:hypothetical protein
MKSKYTFDNLVENTRIRADFFRDYEKLIKLLRRDGHNSIALKHAQNKRRIAEAIALLD